MRLFSVKSPIVGLDIGRHAVRAVWAPSTAPARREVLRLPVDGMGGREALLQWIEQKGLRQAACVIALPGTQTMFQPIRLPPDDPRSDAQAVSVEVLKYTEMMSDAMRYAFGSFSAQSGERRLLVAMARSEVVDETVRRALDLGVQVIEVVPSPMALFQATFHELGDQPVLIVGVGAGSTDVVIGSRAGPFFARAFPVGGRAFTDALARFWKAAPALAQSRKEKEADLEADVPERAVLRAAADAWLNELRACLSVYRNLFPDPGAAPVRLRMRGGGARLRGFPEYAARALGVPLAPRSSAEEEADEEWATARGLVLAATGDTPWTFSLLPETLRDERRLREQKPVWVAAAAVSGLIFLTGLMAGYRDFQRKSALLNAQKTSLLARQRLAGGIESARARNERLQTLGATLQDLLSGAALVRQLIEALHEAKHPEDWITLIADEASYFEKKSEAPALQPVFGARKPETETAPPRFRRVLIEGYTRRGNLASVKKLIETLLAAPFVASADLLSDDEVIPDETTTQEGTAGARRFVLDVRLKER